MTELGHVVLYVRNLERSRRFYGELLGLEEVGDAFDGRAVGLTGGRTHHELLLIEVGEDAPGPPPGRRAGLYHIGFKVGGSDRELKAVRDRLTEAGVEVSAAVDHTVTHSLYLADPDGNEVELYVDVLPPRRWREDPQLILSPPRPLAL